MITIHATEQEMRAAATVSSVVRIADVLLKHVAVTNRLPDLELSSVEQVRSDVTWEDADWHIATDGRLCVEFAAEVRFFLKLSAEAERESESEDETEVVSIKVGYILIYFVPPDPIPREIEERGLPAFSRLNGPYNAWPYLRHEIQHLAGAAGIPYILPLLRIDKRDDTSKSDDVSNA